MKPSGIKYHTAFAKIKLNRFELPEKIHTEDGALFGQADGCQRSDISKHHVPVLVSLFSQNDQRYVHHCYINRVAINARYLLIGIDHLELQFIFFGKRPVDDRFPRPGIQ